MMLSIATAVLGFASTPHDYGSYGSYDDYKHPPPTCSNDAIDLDDFMNGLLGMDCVAAWSAGLCTAAPDVKDK